MLLYYFITLVLSKVTLCQINGEFWWLNDNFAKLQNIEPPKPKFEEISEWETDESVKVVFRENSINSTKRTSVKDNKDELLLQAKVLPYIVFVDRTKLAKQDFIESSDMTTNKNSISINNIIHKNNVKNSADASWKEKNDRDEFQFLFPDDFQNSKTNFMNNSKVSNVTINVNNKNQKHPKTILDDKIWFEDERKTGTETESICTFVSPHECFLRKGLVNMPRTCPTNNPVVCKICCVLPLVSSKLRSPHLTKRHRRSDPGEELSAALKQRNALLLRNYNSQQQAKLVTTTTRTNLVQKIVTPSDYVDPYWNIKDENLNPNQKSKQDYEEDYASELPKPGLLGAYSNRDDRITSWKLKTDKGFSYDGIDEDSEEDYDGGFGYSTIDPRLGNRKTTGPRRRPQRLMTPSTTENAMGTLGSQTIHFHSTPDFHVLEGFKLINLAENKNRFSRTTTPKIFYPSEEETENTSPLIADPDYDDAFDRKLQVFKNCGKERIKVLSEAGSGATKSRCDPWLMVVVLTKNPQNVLCYATIVHPQAAVTAASCVHGKTAGEISAIAGVWDIKERAQSQQRMASIHVHPQFSADGLANDLAILHWKRPLQPPNALPACLADPQVGDECYFVGWGGYDQPLRRRPQYQRASILTPRSCNDRISSPEVDLPADAFCASVETRGTVTGVGGPLLCKGGDRVSVVGVAVYRENVVVLLPAFEWVTSALRELQIS